MDAQSGEGGSGAAPCHAVADEGAEHGLAAHEDVFGHAEIRQEIHLLVDGADAGGLGFARVARADLGTGAADGARVGLMHPRDHLDERALPRPVLPHEGVDLARAQPEVHVLQRREGAEALHDAVELKNSGHDRRGSETCQASRRTRGPPDGDVRKAVPTMPVRVIDMARKNKGRNASRHSRARVVPGDGHS